MTTNFNKHFAINSLTITVTSACNLKCDYCFEQHESRLIKPEEIVKIIDIVWENFKSNYPDSESLPIAIFGGEPLLAFKTIRALVEHAEQQEMNLSIGITTNLTLLTDEMIEFFDEHQIGLLVSIDGVKEVHDKHRDGSFDIVSKNIRRLVEAGLDHLIEARMTIMPEDFSQLVDGIKTIIELGINNIAPIPVTDVSWTTSDVDQLESQMESLFETVLDYYNDPDNKRNISIKMIDDYLYKCVVDNFDHGGVPCSFGSKNWISIGPGGEIFPCHQIHTRKPQRPIFLIGNILTDEIYPERILGEVKPHQWHKDQNSKYTCSNCEAYNICSGGCPSENFDLFNNYDVIPDEWCDYIRTAKRVTEKYQSRILQSTNIRNHQINVLKANLEVVEVIKQIKTQDLMTTNAQMKILDLYERLLSNEENLLPGFREYFLQEALNLQQQIAVLTVQQGDGSNG